MRTRTLLVFLLLLFASTASAQPAESVPIMLGRQKNNFSFDQKLFVGGEVRSFRVGFSAKPAWPVGAVLQIFDAQGRELASFDKPGPDGTVTSPVISGNWARIVITSKGKFVDLSPGTSFFWVHPPEILQRDYKYFRALPLELGVEAIGWISKPGTNTSIARIDPPMGRFSMYLSPYAMNVEHKVKGELGIALVRDANVTSPLPSTFQDVGRMGADTGSYREMGSDGKGQLYLRMEAAVPSFYRVTVQKVADAKGGDPLVVEVDGTLDGVVTAAKADNSSWGGSYFTNVMTYVSPTAPYNRRVHETFVIASASLLATTEGQLRFEEIKVFDSLESTRDVDISFGAKCDRAHAFHAAAGPIGRIEVFRQDLQSPYRGGMLLVHEWGHYDWSMWDEYHEFTQQPFDPNSVMSQQWETIEMCSPMNHVGGNPAQTVDGWKHISGKRGAKIPRPATSAGDQFPQNRSVYLDVLARLESMMRFTHVTNPHPSGMTELAKPCP